MTAVVNKFYDLMEADERVVGFFKNSDMVLQRKRQSQFITFATGGPNNYEGKPLKEVHANMGVADKEFDAAVENLEKACNECGVSKENIAELK